MKLNISKIIQRITMYNFDSSQGKYLWIVMIYNIKVTVFWAPFLQMFLKGSVTLKIIVNTEKSPFDKTHNTFFCFQDVCLFDGVRL